jgi:hypothetical protein
MVRGKKAQVALFIILGIVLLLSVILYVTLQNEDVLGETEFRPTQFSDDEEVASVQLYVQQCFNELSADAIRRSGQQGGHAMLNLWEIDASYSNPTESDGFFLSQSSTNPIPYWHYLLSPNSCEQDCLFFSQAPPLTGPLPSVEAQLNLYVETYLDSCLAEFRAFPNFDVVSSARPKVSTLFREDDVQMKLEYPHDIIGLDKTAQVREWTATHDVPFRRMYELAAILASAQVEYRYLEWHMMEVISLHTGKDMNSMPPLSDNSFNFANTLFWPTEQVAKNLQQLLRIYIPALQVQETKNYRPVVVNTNTMNPQTKAVTERMYKNMELPVSGTKGRYADISANFEYLDFPWYFNVNDNGGIIEPNSVSLEWLPFFGIQDFKTYYDFSFPVRVVLRHDESFAGRGFVFAYGLEANVRDNAPLTSEYVRIGPEFLVEADEEELSNEFCKPNYRTQQEIVITVLNATNSRGLPDVSLIYSCGEIACPIGVTNQSGQFRTTLPVCGGGKLRMISEQTATQEISLSVSNDFADDVQITVQPEVELFIEVKKYQYIKQGDNWVLREGLSDLALTERATISVENVDYGTSTGVYVTGDAGPNEKETIRLKPGSHKVMINVLLAERIFVPREEREFDTGFGTSQTVTIDAVDLKEFISGMTNFDDNSQYWTITNQELTSGNTIVFKVLTVDIANVPEGERVVEDLSQISKFKNLTQEQLTMLRPQIVRR